jgi:hypothetical protein
MSKSMRSGVLLQRTIAPLILKGRFGIESCFGDGQGVTYREVKMPGGPKECRQHALACARRAQTSSTQELRDHFAGLARTWIRLADDLERTLAILDAEEDETEPERQAG